MLMSVTIYSKIKGLSEHNAVSFTFETEPGKRINVQKYMEAKYPKQGKLRYPGLPLIRVGKDAHVPLEYLNIVPGGSFFAKLNPKNPNDAMLVADICKCESCSSSP